MKIGRNTYFFTKRVVVKWIIEFFQKGHKDTKVYKKVFTSKNSPLL